MKSHVEREITELKEKILRMGALVEERITLAVKALVERDAKLAEQVATSDDEVNHMEMDIDEKCLSILALHQPEASDLRFIFATIKINKDLERMGDQAVNIAQRTKLVITSPPLKPLIDIPRMASLARDMIRDVLDAFIKRDIELARMVCERDGQIDALNDQLFRELLTYMMEKKGKINQALQLILISRSLEKIGDHATNIAEDVIFAVVGKDIRHHADMRET
ncbi:MAG: phosphate signaling complex protein PhoU [bacterium]